MNRDRAGYFWIALILAVGLAVALNVITVAILYEAIFRTGSSGISENGTQILTGWGGGIVGVLGAYVGFRAGKQTPPGG
jgi:Co/Zn/Cd efflux system component